MEAYHHLHDVLIFLLAAVVVVSIFRWLRISPIIGYLLAGVCIGPYALGFISEIEGTKILGEFGVVFLLFSIGLKLPLQRLQMLKRYVFGVGALQVLSCGAALGGVAYLLGLPIEASILLGSALALSSTAVGIQILSERGELAARFGRVSFSVLLFQDLMVVVLLVLLTTIGKPETNIVNEFGFAAMKAGTVLAIIIAVGRIILKPVYRAIASLGNPELFVAMTLLVVLTTSVTTAAAGLSMELGAFLAGLLLSETEYRHQVVADIEPFHGLLLGLFFMTVGMSMDLSILVHYGQLVAIFIAGLLLIKILLISLLCSFFKLPWISALRTGLLLASGGEFVFVILGPAMEKGLVGVELGQLVYLAVAISMGLVPLLDLIGKKLEEYYTEREEKTNLQDAVEEIGDLRDHVIVLGYGRVGQLVTKMLTDRMIPFVALDKNMEKVSQGRSSGLPIFYGDARRLHVMRAIGAPKAKVVVVCLNTSGTSMRTALMVKRNFPNVIVNVRMRDDEYMDKLTEAGINVVAPENLEPSLQLAATVLSGMGVSSDEVTQVIDSFRRSLSSSSMSEDDEDDGTLAIGT